MFWKRRQKDPIETCADALYAALKSAVTQGGRIRVEELISAAAAIVGEAAIAKAGDYDPRGHDQPPGARVFSTKINQLICDDKSFQEAPAESIVGDLRERLAACGFSQADFPSLETVFKHFAANIGKKEDWGKVPLSIAREHYPFAQPLQIAYETRGSWIVRFPSLATTPGVDCGRPPRCWPELFARLATYGLASWRPPLQSKR